MVERLSRAGAVSLAKAQPIEFQRRSDRRRLEFLQRIGAIHEATPGEYYVDERAWRRYRATQRRLAFILLGSVGVMLAAGIVVGWVVAAVGR